MTDRAMADGRASTRVSTPGKLILMGEHAAVYGAPALVTAIGLRLETRLERTGNAGVELDLPAIGHREHLSATEIGAYCEAQREAWELYATNPGPDTFADLDDGEPARLARVALGECAELLGGLDGLQLRVVSDLPLGAGFGSSAAAAVGIIAAAVALAGGSLRWSQVGPMAAQVERRQHGFPSGVDAATVFHGGVLSVLRGADDLELEPLMARPDLLNEIRVVNTGAPAESTGEVVASVAARRADSPETFDETLATMRDATTRFRRLITAPATESADLLEPVHDYQRELESIGVVPDAVKEIVREIERSGGAAKLSGAGALSGECAGCLLILLPEERELPAGLDEVLAPLAAEGVRVESVA